MRVKLNSKAYKHTAAKLIEEIIEIVIARNIEEKSEIAVIKITKFPSRNTHLKGGQGAAFFRFPETSFT
jgi:hypothetical protein